MMVRFALAVVLLSGAALAIEPQTVTPVGTPARNAVTIQGSPTGTPMPVTGTLSVAGAADTVGANTTFSSNGVCATVATAGQQSVGFFLAAGTLAATVTPSVSEDATISTPSCSSGNWTASSFVDISGNSTSTQAFTNPNTFFHAGIKTLGGTRCVRVCTTSFSSGSAVGNLVAVTVPSPAAAAGADVTDRAGRLLGVISTGSNVIGHVIADTGSTTAVTGTVAISAAALPLPTGASTSALQTTGNTSLSSIDGKVPALGQALAAASTPVVLTAAQVTTLTPPAAITGFSTETTLALIKAKTDNLDVALSTRTKPADSQTVTGTVAATQSGTWTVQPGNTANTTAWKVDGSAVTQPVSGTVTATSASIGATGAAVPGSANYAGINVGGNLTGAVGGHGTAASALRVELPTDGTGVVGLAAGAATIGALVANQTVDLARVAGSAVATAATGIAKFGMTDGLGNSTNSAATGFLKVTDEPRQVFYDSFDSTLDIVNLWSLTRGSGATGASVSAGVLMLGTGTTANGFSKLSSIATFKPTIPGWVVFSDAIALADGAAPTANSYRYWGSGTTPVTPVATAPVTDGYGFELNTDGKLRAVVYAGGTRTVIADLSSSGTSTQPLNSSYHRYVVQVRTDRTFWYIDTIDSAGLVATSNFQSSQAQILPKLFLAIAGSTPPGSDTQIQCTGAVVSDTGKNGTYLADGANPSRRASISAAGALKVDTTGSAPTQLLTGVDRTIGALAQLPFAVWNQNLSQLGGAPVATGNGIGTSATQRVSIAQDSCPNSIAINQTASTDLYTSSKFIHICSIVLVSAAAQNVSLVEGTGSVCATQGTALMGGTTASIALAANGGFSSVAGTPWLHTVKTADHLCLLQSAANNVSGVITYRDGP